LFRAKRGISLQIASALPRNFTCLVFDLKGILKGKREHKK